MPSAYYPPLDKQFEEFILRAVARQPEDRFANVSELIEAADGEIERLGIEVPGAGAAQEPTDEDHEEPRPPRQPEPQKQDRMGVWVALGIWIGALVIGALVGTLAWPQ